MNNHKLEIREFFVEYLKLPLIQEDENVSFYEFLENEFSKKLDLLKNNLDVDSKIIYSLATEIENFKKLTDGLLGSIKEYLNGKPHKAILRIRKLLRSSRAYNTRKEKSIVINSNFYRIRTYEKLPYKKEDLFHIKYEDRRKVKNQRYSISGFPCLYLASSAELALQEKDNPEKFLMIRLTNQKVIDILDLTSNVFNFKSLQDEMTDSELFLQLAIWPIIASCSVKIASEELEFKPEYIVPQLLMQLNNNGPIKYSSTKSKKNQYNLVVPVKTYAHRGHCTKLKKLFLITEAEKIEKKICSSEIIDLEIKMQTSKLLKI